MNLSLDKKNGTPPLLENLRENINFGNIILKNFANLNIKETEMVRMWRNSESIRRWMYQNHTISPSEHIMFIKKLKSDNRNFYWIVQNNEEIYIGVISLNRFDINNLNAYLGIYSNPGCKVSGAGHLLIECLKKLAFNIINLHTLKLEAIDYNKQAINFYKKSGFREEGRLKEFIFKDDKWYDMVVMGIFSSRA